MAIPIDGPLTEEDRAMWTERLKEARSAYHKLTIGEGVAAFTDQNGERVSFAKVEQQRLANYIADMVALLGTPVTPRTSAHPRPLRFFIGG